MYVSTSHRLGSAEGEEFDQTGRLFRCLLFLSAFLLYTLQVAMAFGLLSSLYGDFMQAVGASMRIFELLDRKPEVPNSGGEEPDTFAGGKGSTPRRVLSALRFGPSVPVMGKSKISSTDSVHCRFEI